MVLPQTLQDEVMEWLKGTDRSHRLEFMKSCLQAIESVEELGRIANMVTRCKSKVKVKGVDTHPPSGPIPKP